MDSYGIMHRQQQQLQAGTPSQAPPPPPYHPMENHQYSNTNNAYQSRPVTLAVQPPQGPQFFHPNGDENNQQIPQQQIFTGPHQIVFSSQTATGNITSYNSQTLHPNSQPVSTTMQKNNSYNPAASGFSGNKDYKYSMMLSNLIYTSVQYEQTAKDNSSAIVAVSDRETPQNQVYRQNYTKQDLGAFVSPPNVSINTTTPSSGGQIIPNASQNTYQLNSRNYESERAASNSMSNQAQLNSMSYQAQLNSRNYQSEPAASNSKPHQAQLNSRNYQHERAVNNSKPHQAQLNSRNYQNEQDTTNTRNSTSFRQYAAHHVPLQPAAPNLPQQQQMSVGTKRGPYMSTTVGSYGGPPVDKSAVSKKHQNKDLDLSRILRYLLKNDNVTLCSENQPKRQLPVQNTQSEAGSQGGNRNNATNGPTTNNGGFSNGTQIASSHNLSQGTQLQKSVPPQIVTKPPLDATTFQSAPHLSVKPKDTCVELSPGCLGTKAVAVVQPLPGSYLVASNSAFFFPMTSVTSINPEKGPISPIVTYKSDIPITREEFSSCQDYPDSVPNPVPRSKVGSVSRTPDSGFQSSTQISDLSTQMMPKKPSVTPMSENSPEDQKLKEMSPTSSGFESPSPLTSPQMSVEQPRSHVLLKEHEVYTEEPYKSSWLNVNEQLDDIDNEFGFPLALMSHFYKQERDEKPNEALTAEGLRGLLANEEISSKTQAGPEEGETTVPQAPLSQSALDSESKCDVTDSFDSIKVVVLSQEEAKRIYEQLYAERIKDDDAVSSGANVSDGKVISVEEVGSVSTMETGSSLSTIQCTKPQPVEQRDSLGKDVQEVIDLTDSDPLTSITISDEEKEVSKGESNTPNQTLDPDTSVSSEPVQTMSAISVLEETVKTLFNLEGPPLKRKRRRLQRDDSRRFKNKSKAHSRSDPGSARVREVVAECKNPDVAKCEKPVAYASDAQGLSKIGKPVQLSLFGSKQKDCLVSSAEMFHTNGVTFQKFQKPPEVLSVHPSPEDSIHPFYMGSTSAKQRIHEKWRESFHPTETRKKKKSVSGNSPNRGRKPVSSKMRSSDGRTRPRSNESKAESSPDQPRQEERDMKYSVSIKGPAFDKKSKNPDKIVLKFTVSPDHQNSENEEEEEERKQKPDSGSPAKHDLFLTNTKPLPGKDDNAKEACTKGSLHGSPK